MTQLPPGPGARNTDATNPGDVPDSQAVVPGFVVESQVHTDQSRASQPQGAPTDTGPSLRSVNVLEFLRSVGLSDPQIAELASTYPTWQELRNAPTLDLAAIGGQDLAMTDLPVVPPPAPALPSGVVAVPRHSLLYPPQLRALPSAPSILHVEGELPQQPLIAVVGAEYSSPAGMEIARGAAAAALKAGGVIVAAPATQIGAMALREAVELQQGAVVVLSHGIAMTTAHRWLCDAALEAGGAVVSARPASATADPVGRSSAHQLVAGLAAVMLVCEVGTTPAEGSEPVAAAVMASRPLVVPINPDLLLPGAYIPSTAAGSYLLARPGMDIEAVFGPGLRARERAAQLLAAADQTPHHPDDVAAALQRQLHP